MSVKDAEHQLNLEISENETRKDFSKAERIDYAKRLRVIEELKAKEVSLANLKNQNVECENFHSRETGRTSDIVADKLGVGSGRQLEKEEFIVANKDSLTPEDFADWDERYKSRKKPERYDPFRFHVFIRYNGFSSTNANKASVKN